MKIEKSKTWSRSQSQTEGSLWEICLFAVFFIVIFSAVSRANAQTPVSTGSVSTSAQAAKPAKMKASAKLLLETTRTLQEDEPESYGGLYQLTLGLSNFAPNWSANAKLGYSREYSYERDDGTDGSFENPTAGVSRKFTIDKGIDALTLGFSGAIGANRESQRRTFIGSMGTSVRATKAIRRFDLAQTFGYTRGFYEYDIRDDGTVNSPDSLRSVTELGLNVTDKLALSASVALTHAINYQGNGKTVEASALSVDYSFSDNVQASLGVATDRGTLEVDGETNRVKVFDPNAASAFFDLVIGI